MALLELFLVVAGGLVMEGTLQMELLAREQSAVAAQEWSQLLPGLLLRMC